MKKISLGFIFLSILFCSTLLIGCNKNTQKDIVFDSIFAVSENDVYAEVDNNVNYFSFNGKIATNNDYSYSIYKDKEGLTEIPTNTIDLSIGNNICYLLLKNSNNKKTLYTICIRRLPMYSVTLYKYYYQTDIGLASEIYQTIQVQEGKILNMSTYTPTRNGYHFVGWDCGNTIKIVENTNIVGLWEGNKHIVYVNISGNIVQYNSIYGEYLTIPIPEKPDNIPSYYNFWGFFDSNNNEHVFNRNGEFFYNSPTGGKMRFSFDKDIYVYARWGND